LAIGLVVLDIMILVRNMPIALSEKNIEINLIEISAINTTHQTFTRHKWL